MLISSPFLFNRLFKEKLPGAWTHKVILHVPSYLGHLVTKAHLEDLFPVLIRISLTRDNQAVFQGLPNVLAMRQRKPKPRWFTWFLSAVRRPRTEERPWALCWILQETETRTPMASLGLARSPCFIWLYFTNAKGCKTITGRKCKYLSLWPDDQERTCQ